MSTLVEDQTMNVDLNARQEALEQRVLLLCPSIGWWKGMYQLPTKTTDTTSDGITVDKEDVTTPRAKLMTDKYPVDRSGVPWKKRFQKIESRLSALKEQFSVPFPITGVRVVPKSRGQQLMNEMYGLTIGRLRNSIAKLRTAGQYFDADRVDDQLRAALVLEGANALPNTPVYDPAKAADNQSVAYELHQAAVEFCNDWENIRRQIATENTVFSQVESRVPHSAGAMREKFTLDVVPIELAGSRPTSLTQDDLAEHSAIIQEACRRRVDEAIETIVQGPRQQLVDALASLQELVNRDGRVSSKSFAPVRAAIAKIRMFDFAADPGLLQNISDLERRLNTTSPNSLDRITAANTGFNAALTRFQEEVQDAASQAAAFDSFGCTNRNARSIDLD